jgi:hypothetical protein
MGELDELKEEIEELRDEIESLKEDSDSEEDSEDGEDENRDLYIYIQFLDDVMEIMGMDMEKRMTLLVEDDGSYQIPQLVEAEHGSTTRQVIEFIKGLGIDVWESVERCGEREDSVYYRVLIPDSIAGQVEEGVWVNRQKTENMTSMEEREYL